MTLKEWSEENVSKYKRSSTSEITDIDFLILREKKLSGKVKQPRLFDLTPTSLLATNAISMETKSKS